MLKNENSPVLLAALGTWLQGLCSPRMRETRSAGLPEGTTEEQLCVTPGEPLAQPRDSSKAHPHTVTETGQAAAPGQGLPRVWYTIWGYLGKKNHLT